MESNLMSFRDYTSLQNFPVASNDNINSDQVKSIKNLQKYYFSSQVKEFNQNPEIRVNLIDIQQEQQYDQQFNSFRLESQESKQYEEELSPYFKTPKLSHHTTEQENFTNRSVAQSNRLSINSKIQSKNSEKQENTQRSNVQVQTNRSIRSNTSQTAISKENSSEEEEEITEKELSKEIIRIPSVTQIEDKNQEQIPSIQSSSKLRLPPINYQNSYQISQDCNDLRTESSVGSKQSRRIKLENDIDKEQKEYSILKSQQEELSLLKDFPQKNEKNLNKTLQNDFSHNHLTKELQNNDYIIMQSQKNSNFEQKFIEQQSKKQSYSQAQLSSDNDFVNKNDHERMLLEDMGLFMDVSSHDIRSKLSELRQEIDEEVYYKMQTMSHSQSKNQYIHLRNTNKIQKPINEYINQTFDIDNYKQKIIFPRNNVPNKCRIKSASKMTDMSKIVFMYKQKPITRKIRTMKKQKQILLNQSITKKKEVSLTPLQQQISKLFPSSKKIERTNPIIKLPPLETRLSKVTKVSIQQRPQSRNQNVFHINHSQSFIPKFKNKLKGAKLSSSFIPNAQTKNQSYL